MLRAEPTGPVSGFECFELVAAGDGVEEDEVGDGGIQTAEGL